MDTTFPFGFPAATAFYLTMYILTFVLHQAFMHYVLAGSLCLTWFTISKGRDSVAWTEQPLQATLRDWIPFLLSAAITGLVYILFVEASAKSLVFGKLGLLYLIGCALGIGLQCCCWIPAWRSDRLRVRGLLLATAGSLLTLVSTAVLREGVRIRAIDLSSLAPLHAEAAKVGGFIVFLVASVVVSLLIAWCIHLVRTGIRSSNV